MFSPVFILIGVVVALMSKQKQQQYGLGMRLISLILVLGMLIVLRVVTQLDYFAYAGLGYSVVKLVLLYQQVQSEAVRVGPKGAYFVHTKSTLGQRPIYKIVRAFKVYPVYGHYIGIDREKNRALFGYYNEKGDFIKSALSPWDFVTIEHINRERRIFN